MENPGNFYKIPHGVDRFYFFSDEEGQIPYRYEGSNEAFERNCPSIEEFITDLDTECFPLGVDSRKGHIGEDPTFGFCFLGDLVDHGPHSVALLRYMIQCKRVAPERVVLILGNRDLNKIRMSDEYTVVLEDGRCVFCHETFWKDPEEGTDFDFWTVVNKVKDLLVLDQAGFYLSPDQLEKRVTGGICPPPCQKAIGSTNFNNPLARVNFLYGKTLGAPNEAEPVWFRIQELFGESASEHDNDEKAVALCLLNMIMGNNWEEESATYKLLQQLGAITDGECACTWLDLNGLYVRYIQHADVIAKIQMDGKLYYASHHGITSQLYEFGNHPKRRAEYTHADGTVERVIVVKKHAESEGGGFTVFIPSLNRERQTVAGQLRLLDEGEGDAVLVVEEVHSGSVFKNYRDATGDIDQVFTTNDDTFQIPVSDEEIDRRKKRNRRIRRFIETSAAGYAPSGSSPIVTGETFGIEGSRPDFYDHLIHLIEEGRRGGSGEHGEDRRDEGADWANEEGFNLDGRHVYDVTSSEGKKLVTANIYGHIPQGLMGSIRTAGPGHTTHVALDVSKADEGRGASSSSFSVYKIVHGEPIDTLFGRFTMNNASNIILQRKLLCDGMKDHCTKYAYEFKVTNVKTPSDNDYLKQGASTLPMEHKGYVTDNNGSSYNVWYNTLDTKPPGLFTKVVTLENYDRPEGQ